MKNIFIGILIGIVVLVGLYFYHTNQTSKSYEKGVEDGFLKCQNSFINAPGDTITIHDTIYTGPKKIKPYRKPIAENPCPKLAIDTTIYFQEAGKVRVWSDDIAEGLEIEPIYYLEYKEIHDTVYVLKEVPQPEKPAVELAFYEKPGFLLTTGAVIGGAIVYYLREK